MQKSVQGAKDPLLIKPKVCEVVVLHHILLRFEALFPGALGLGFAPGSDKIFKADDLGADKALLNIGVDRARSFPGGDSFANGPGAIFFAADCQEANIARLSKSA